MKKNVLFLRFVERAKAVHGENYLYTLVKYRGANKQVIIICRRHGIFKMTPSQLLSGKGCPYCKDNHLTREEFFSQINVIYGGMLDCTKSTYTHKTCKSEYITVTCKVHGDFLQRVDSLLNGLGCRKCAREKKRNAKLSGNMQPEPNSSVKSEIDDVKITYPVVLRFKTNKSKTNGYLWTEPFESKPEAEKFVEGLKLCLEMTDSVVIEATIIEKNNKYLDIDNAKKLIAWLNIESIDAYVLWWDELRPSFIPRDVLEHYSDINKMFGNDEIGIVISMLNKIKLSDSDDRQRA
jgi:hypothetical protein